MSPTAKTSPLLSVFNPFRPCVSLPPLAHSCIALISRTPDTATQCVIHTLAYTVNDIHLCYIGRRELHSQSPPPLRPLFQRPGQICTHLCSHQRCRCEFVSASSWIAHLDVINELIISLGGLECPTFVLQYPVHRQLVTDRKPSALGKVDCIGSFEGMM
jgi:hypothetical protein